MREYPKIQTAWKRNPETKLKTLLEGEWSLPEFALLADVDWIWTEKIDGTNIRVIWDGEKVRFAGKTNNSQIPARLVARLQDLFPAERFADMPSCVLYGEGYGAKIQKGGGNYKPDGVDFILFDAAIDGLWLNRDTAACLASELGINIAPRVGEGPLSGAIDHCRKPFRSLINDNAQAEGLVMRPAVPLFFRDGTPIMAKIKVKDFQ